jgi:hypothetical protein
MFIHHLGENCARSRRILRAQPFSHVPVLGGQICCIFARWIAPRRARVYHGAKRSGEIKMRRVVVTGLGMVTPLACGVEETWARLIAGQSGAGPITRFDPSGVVTQYACEIPLGDGTGGTFNADDWMEPKGSPQGR